MDDASLVRGCQTGGDLLGVIDGLANKQRAVIQLCARYFAFKQLGDDIGRALVIADVIFCA